MKREIEFRGRTAKGEWVYGDLLNLHNGDKYIVNNKFGACIDDKGNFINTESPFVCKVIPETVGQYTGIKDKNGKKVYVGDIIKASHNFYPYTVFVRECKVCIEDKYGNAIRPTTEALKHFDCEVIGTVFDKERDNGD